MTNKVVKLGKHEVSYTQFRHNPPPPGPDLDVLVFEAMGGVLGCTGWEVMNLGSAGGPVLRKTSCPHAHGACATARVIKTIHGTIGGVPEYSRICVPLSDLPTLWKVYRINDLYFVAFDDFPITGKTEAHVRALAYLAARSWGCTEPVWTDENRFDLEAAKHNAHRLGLPWPLVAPWTPETVAKAERIANSVNGRPPWAASPEEIAELQSELTAAGITDVLYEATVGAAIQKRLEEHEELMNHSMGRAE